MKNITIGSIDLNWKVAATARYYAERGNGEEYAFGSTPAEALAQLEAREAAASSAFDNVLAEEIAFLALGAADAFNSNPDASLDAHDGYVGFIGQVIRHAPMLAKRWMCMSEGEFTGVWLYEVTERFGREWAEVLISGADESPSERLEYIINDEMKK